MSKVTVLRGYSASGKSTWAKHSGAFVVSRDLVRAQITGNDTKTVLDPAGEQLVTDIEIAQITSAVKRGVNVVVDNTNLVARYARRYIDLAVKLGATWEVMDFFTDLPTCIAQNNNRLRHGWVPPSVIENQARRFPIKNWPVLAPSTPAGSAWEPYVPDETKPRAIAVDLDGTLALHNGRNPYDTSKYHEDTVCPVVREMLDLADVAGYYILVVTGRDAAFRSVCSAWLSANAVGYDELFMRPEGDTRRDDIIKMEILDNQIAPDYNLRWVIDDRDRVVDAWRSRGVKVAQIARGDF